MKTKVVIGLSMFGIIIVITALSSVYFILGILSCIDRRVKKDVKPKKLTYLTR